MAEQLTLSSAETIPAKNTTFYRVVRLVLDWEAQAIVIGLRGENNELKSFNYDGATALSLMVGLNKANLSTKSLQARILERLAVDGKLPGTVSGTPD